MTDRGMSPEELDQIERRCAAATAGPWQSFVEGRDHHGGDDFIRTGGLDDTSPDMYVSLSTADGTQPAGPADLDLIAHARQDLPNLVAALRERAGGGLVPELLTEPTNYAVVQLPGRRFPGVVFQGDSLGGLCAELRAVLELEDTADLRGELEVIVGDLDQILQTYLDVLTGRGDEPPTAYRPRLA